jgi:hypothetical protein
MADIIQTYEELYHGYPIFTEPSGFEGSVKRYTTAPTPQDLINFGLKGLPKVYPLTNEPITLGDVERYLVSAYTEIEMAMSMDLSPVQHYQSFDYVADMFEANWGGMRLDRFPATKILHMQLKFPHTQMPVPLTAYTIPASWLVFRRNRVNLAAGIGAVSVSQGGAGQAGTVGIFSYFAGFARGAYQPAVVEVAYQSGFDNDKMPAVVADLILTVACIRMLSDMGPVLFPFSSSSVSIDSVAQSAGLPGPGFLMNKIAALEKKRQEQEAAIKAQFGRSIKMTVIGS